MWCQVSHTLCCWKHLFSCDSHEGQLWAVKSGQYLRAAAPWEQWDGHCWDAERSSSLGSAKLQFCLLFAWASPPELPQFPLGVPEEQCCCPQGQAGLGQKFCSQTEHLTKAQLSYDSFHKWIINQIVYSQSLEKWWGLTWIFWKYKYPSSIKQILLPSSLQTLLPYRCIQFTSCMRKTYTLMIYSNCNKAVNSFANTSFLL